MATRSVTMTASTGTMTATAIQRGRVLRVTVLWISTAGGDAAGVLSDMYGLLRRIATVPDGGGTQPTNNYTLAVKGPGANLHSAANANTVGNEFSLSVADDGAAAYDAPLVSEDLTLTIAAAGNAKGGTVYLYFDLLDK